MTWRTQRQALKRELPRQSSVSRLAHLVAAAKAEFCEDPRRVQSQSQDSRARLQGAPHSSFGTRRPATFASWAHLLVPEANGEPADSMDLDTIDRLDDDDLQEKVEGNAAKRSKQAHRAGPEGAEDQGAPGEEAARAATQSDTRLASKTVFSLSRKTARALQLARCSTKRLRLF